LKSLAKGLTALTVIAFLLWPSLAVGQGDAPARIKSRSELVVVPVTVKDNHGNLISDLRRDDFRIFEDGVEQQIALFSEEPFPLSAVVLVEDSLSLKSAEQVQKSLISIAAGFGPADEVALMMYDEFPQTVLDFTSNNDQFYTQLKRTRIASEFPGDDTGPMTAGPRTNGRSDLPGVPNITDDTPSKETSCLTDAVYAAGEMLRTRGRDRRKIIFLISDGANSRRNKMSTDDTIHLLLSADVSVYTISTGRALLKHESRILEKYAVATGGDFFYASKQADLERLYKNVTEEARNQFTLAYAPKNQDRSKDYHLIEVRVKRPGLDLNARQGYYSAIPR